MNHTAKFKGVLTAREEFLYPDSPVYDMPGQLYTATAKNGQKGIQLLLQTNGKKGTVLFESEELDCEFYRMHKIPVEYNTGDGEEQGGAMVLTTPTEKKPAYATKKAPFFVYDCFEPLKTTEVMSEDNFVAVYFCLKLKENLLAGKYYGNLHVSTEEGEYCCRIEMNVYSVIIPSDTFPVTNWFSLEAISRFHKVKMGTAEYYDMLRKYVLAMRRIHQTMFFIQISDECIVSRNPYTFDFEYLKPIIEIFFQEGMQTMEIGPVLLRGDYKNGKDDPYTEKFTCSMAPDVLFDSEEGYKITVCFFKALKEFLEKYGWENKVYFHLHDEPDIHIKTQEGIENRRKQYYQAKCLMHRFFPTAKVIEAVDSTQFKGGVDLWVTGTAGYEKHKKEFNQLIELGESVWAYVCCGPSGHWLNRFLDFAVLKGRLLFWGCAANRLDGFLHWGFNQFIHGLDPFKATSCHNSTGIGTNFPCGDAFLVYPGDDGPWLGMRLEAQRRGAEDVALLRILREQDEEAYDRLMSRVFTNNYTYNDDPIQFEKIYEDMLKILSKDVE